VCVASTCQPARCADNVKNGAETDVDCGGGCPACGPGLRCNLATECTSLVCKSNVCQPATCMDGVRNGFESDADCGGGGCAACADLKTCTGNADCASLRCVAARCVSCMDMTRNGTETDVDCGGASCGKCPDLKRCLIASDCA